MKYSSLEVLMSADMDDFSDVKVECLSWRDLVMNWIDSHHGDQKEWVKGLLKNVKISCLKQERES
jgi:hypothetical protein